MRSSGAAFPQSGSLISDDFVRPDAMQKALIEVGKSHVGSGIPTGIQGLFWAVLRRFRCCSATARTSSGPPPCVSATKWFAAKADLRQIVYRGLLSGRPASVL